MIPSWRVAEVRRMLAGGRLSQRKIAEQTGISRETVRAIALGRRPDRENRPSPRDDHEPFPGPVRRCPGCGGMVQLPCLLCRVRGLRERDRLSRRGCC